MKKDDTKKTVYMPQSLARQIENRAEKEKRSVTSLILLILEDAMKQRKG